MSAFGVQKVNWWHERIVDWELANPDGKMGECAAFFSKTEPWLSTVRNCDAYIEYRSRRIADHQEMLSVSVIDKVEGLAHLTLDTMKERIEAEKATVSLSFLRETTDSALRALGYTQPRGGGGNATVQVVNINAASPEALARAREKMQRTNVVPAAPGKLLEHTHKEVTDSDGSGENESPCGCEVPAPA